MRSSSPICVVGGGVGERERQHALLLEVRLVDAGEAAGEDHLAAAEPGLHGGVLARAALAVVLVADGAPARRPRRGGGGRCRGTSGSRRRAGPCRGRPRTLRRSEGVDRRRGTGCRRCSRGGRGTCSHGPAAEMWSVVHLPLAFISTGRLDEVVAVPRGRRARAAAGARCRGDTSTVDVGAVGRRGDEAGLAGVEAPVAGSSSPTGGSSRTCSPSAVVSVSVSGSKSSVPARARATTMSGEVTNASVLALPSLRFGKLRL